MEYYLTEAPNRLKDRLEAGVIREVLLTGYPGTGKTSFAEFYSAKRGAQYLYYLCHPWTTDEDMFNVLDVAAIAAGIEDKAQGWQPGILRLAAEASQKGHVVLCLDEIDKVSSKVEVLLLDFLQTGRVPLPDHTSIQARQEKLVVFLTSNGARQFSDALLRRVYRFRMDFLPPHVEADILRKQTGAAVPVIKTVLRLAQLLRSNEQASKPSLSEMALLCRCLVSDSPTPQSVRDDVVATLCKTEEDLDLLDKQVRGWAALLHGQIVQERYLVR